ncbi:peptidoglycan D,D-transpeptidase FtsI family protein [Shimia haliotis]|uniref:Cell division protein FtsI (Penicillin-binding protein 3) n=1 Tax=Shimia haliotis TaxID=1280847 RepID=A0A1I4A5E4_9RHOB|nr:penicillin-binding protein 2 [Shimia haliotis]SFK51565.1 cell division protein FtsI (penicillin-binding protein 3) [Shimia haliotis]
MTRKPLRPLASILKARKDGESAEAIERANLRERHDEMQNKARVRAEGRLLVMSFLFLAAFGAVGTRMGAVAMTDATEPRRSYSASHIQAERADIVDRKGRILATNLETHALYAQPPHMIDKERVARELAAIFPDLDEDRLVKDFTGKRKFLWVKKKLSPEQKQAVHDIGDPGLQFGRREMRLYPNGQLAAHVLGGSTFGEEDVHAAELVGVAGVEKYFDEVLRDPANGGRALTLSLDLTVQDASERVLYGGMKLMNAKGASSVLMDVHTGEIISMVSLPDFDPNDRPRVLTEGNAGDSPLFNRSVQGLYELGSTFKIFTAAQSMDLGLANPSTLINTAGPLRWGKFKIRDFRNYGSELTVTKIIVKSSNIGTARMAQVIGAVRQQDFLGKLGFLKPTEVELVEAKGAQPLLPRNWSELSTMTISYGHGMSASPLHLAAGYAAIANGGTQVSPTILKRDRVQEGARVMSASSAAAARKMLRKVVSEGTASFGEVPGYAVGGKTGTADKPKERGGGYYEDKVIATFAAMFPAHAPKYVLIVSLDEPVETSGTEPRRTAGWTAVPVAAEMIARVAPLLGLRPQVEPAELADITLTSN